MMPSPESVFGQLPPAEACAVRLRLRLRRKGNPPAVTVHALTEEALLEAMHGSEKIRAWVSQSDRARSDPAPARRVFPGDLTWLDSAGRALSHPKEVLFPFELPLSLHPRSAASARTACPRRRSR